MAVARHEFTACFALWTRLTALILALGSAGCCMPGPILSTSRPNVIVLRGMGGYFPKLGEFEDRLIDEGLCPTVAHPDAHAELAERVIAARNTGRLQGPLVIVGYSQGAGRALLLSRRLGERGIPVDKLVLLESPEDSRVPGNVRECVNIYKPQPWGDYVPLFTGCRVTSESPATTIVNYNVREFNDGRYEWDNHITLTANPYIQDLLIDEVLEGIERAPQNAAAIADGPETYAADGRLNGADEVPPPADQEPPPPAAE